MNLLGREVRLDQPIFLISGLTTLVALDRLVKERGFEEADL